MAPFLRTSVPLVVTLLVGLFPALLFSCPISFFRTEFSFMLGAAGVRTSVLLRTDLNAESTVFSSTGTRTTAQNIDVEKDCRHG